MSGCSKPASSRNSVVLPQPEGPSSVKNSFEKRVSDTLSSALTAPVPEPKVFETFSTRTSFVVLASTGAKGQADEGSS